MLYRLLNDGRSQRITNEDCDAVEQAGIIDRTLLPVLETGHGWADSRRSSYTVTGNIGAKRSHFQLFDEGVPIAVLAVCLHQRANSATWGWLHTNAANMIIQEHPAPPPPWVALRYDVHQAALPTWLGWWAKHVGFALLTRQGW